ncbi:hypothetical protein [Shewanella sp. GD04112]|uniref:hypothetical protein n=1 Tax=Shewanella sp. GD04112 TaxID=2975434 RepID=UPI002446E8F3|nr:hypothetical protein [Shewanella sp. GD04112]MDH0448806.1 hypothetical protein [Shewanella sp. GD04112]
MSTKEWVYQDNEPFGLYQEITFDKDNDNPAVIEITNPIDFKIIYESDAEGKFFGSGVFQDSCHSLFKY